VIFIIDLEKAYDSVKWRFLEEVLNRKSFDEQLIRKIMSTMRGGRVCININGDNGPYFKTHRGLTQEDPLSPLLFILLVGDALAHMLNTAKQKGHVRGLVPHLVEGGLTELHYANDTILFLEYDDTTIRNLKFLLYCFEWMTGFLLFAWLSTSWCFPCKLFFFFFVNLNIVLSIKASFSLCQKIIL